MANTLLPFALPTTPVLLTEPQQEIIHHRLTQLNLTRTQQDIITLLLTRCYNPDLISQLASAEDMSHDNLSTFYAYVADTALAGITAFATSRHYHNGTSVMGSSVSSTPHDSSDHGQSIPRSKAAAEMCRKRDHHRCIITGRGGDDWPLEVAHILPYGTSKEPSCRQRPFWKLLELFIGIDRTEALWQYIGGANINRLENLIVLDPSIHKLFDKGTFFLVPQHTPTSTSAINLDFTWNGKGSLLENLITTLRSTNLQEHSLLSSARRVAAREPFRIFTPDSVNLPLPNPELLVIHRAINSLRVIRAMAAFNNSDDNDEAYFSDGIQSHSLADDGALELLKDRLSGIAV